MIKKKVLIIGGYGFLGCNILTWIDKNKNYDVSILSSLRSASNHYKFNCVKEKFFGDFGDEIFMKSLFVNSEFDYIFHCLTTTSPANSNFSIVKDIESNLINTVRLLDMIKGSKSKLIFFSSGGAIYGYGESIVHKVGDTPNPISSYGVVKNSIEHYISIYNKLYGLKYLNIRISNPYGYFHKSRIQGLINIAIRKSLANEPIEVWGNGENVKDYIFAEDIPPIIFELLDKNVINKTLNLGSGKGVSINEILELLAKINPRLKIDYKESKTFDVKDFILDISDIGSNIKLTSLEEGILKTYEWEKQKLLNI